VEEAMSESTTDLTHEPLAYVCSHVFSRTTPILLVIHADGDWQFLCGGSHDHDERPRVVGMNHLVDDDVTLKAVLDLPVDWEAERGSAIEPWARKKFQP
jgi:hypothetical protein